MITRVQESLNIRIPLRVIFDQPTLEEFAQSVEVLQWVDQASTKDDLQSSEEEGEI